MKILFMGTPDIAAESLDALINAGHNICAVFTREDKPFGRKQVLTSSAVKQLALRYDIPVFQPKTLRDSEAEGIIRSFAPQIIVVVAYGRILPRAVLDIPALGCINLHVSLLPKYRGAAPIQWAVINGDLQTGVTIMHMDEGVDTGDIISTLNVQIDDDETSGELFAKVSSAGAKELCETLVRLENGAAKRTKQDHTKSSHAPMLTKEMACFDFTQSHTVLHNLVRGLNPWPIAYFVSSDKKIKVLKTIKHSGEDAECGKVISINPLIVACGGGALELCDLVPEGSKPMSGSAWAAGKRLSIGDII